MARRVTRRVQRAQSLRAVVEPFTIRDQPVHLHAPFQLARGLRVRRDRHPQPLRQVHRPGDVIHVVMRQHHQVDREVRQPFVEPRLLLGIGAGHVDGAQVLLADDVDIGVRSRRQSRRAYRKDANPLCTVEGFHVDILRQAGGAASVLP
jgi:hypothetical protein